MTSPKAILSRILFLLYLCAIAMLCFMHTDKLPDVQKFILGIPTDKVVHFCMFFPFPILAFLSFDRYTETVSRTLLFVGATFLVGILLAVGTEWAQAHLTDYRSGDPLDFLADGLSLLLSSALVAFWDIRKQKS